MKQAILALGVALAMIMDSPAQNLTTLHSFIGSDGANPYAGLTFSGSTLYGTTELGGSSNGGAIFKINIDGSSFTNLKTFSSDDGAGLITDLLLSDNMLYGVGANYDSVKYDGTVFKINTDGSNFTSLHHFSFSDGSNGYAPEGNLILLGNTLYGTTAYGGSSVNGSVPSGNGTVFQVNTDSSNFTNLYSFTGDSNASPRTGLILLSNTLYGTTYYGGNLGDGAVFRVNTDGSGFTNLYSFSGANDGGNPLSTLILSGKTLYGATTYGGNSSDGTLFKVYIDGSNYENLHNFSGSDGANPHGSLILFGNILYGTTFNDGSSGKGTVFRVNIDGSNFTNIYNFTGGNDGANPHDGIIILGNTLYGTTFAGGSSGDGTVFALGLMPSAPIVITQPQSQTVQVGSNVTVTVAANGSSSLSYQWFFNGSQVLGQTNTTFQINNVQLSNGGNYSVTITNAYGSTNSAIAQLTVFTNLLVVQTNKPPPPPGVPTIPTDATQFKVFTNGGFVIGIGLDHSKATIVLTHGFNNSSSGWPLEMANIIKFELGTSTPNIVAWDWTAVAAEPLSAATLDTQGQGYALGEDLAAALGKNYSQRIHFIGHSLGTLVNARAANYIHANGFSWANTQMTLFDDAEVAWGLVGNSWATLTSLLQNDSSPQPDWIQPLPTNCAWADNYITAVGIPHAQAVNVILTNLTPNVSNIQNLFDFFKGAWTGLFKTEITTFHNYPHDWYYNTVNQINNPNDPPYLMGFQRSWEGGGTAGRPSANTYYIESQNSPPGFSSYSGYDPDYNLVQITADQADQYLNARPQNLISQVGVNLISSSANILANNNNQQVQILNGPVAGISSLITGTYNAFETAFATEVELQTTSLINGLVRPLGGPVPRGGSAGNSPAYVWIPVTVPSNALTMAFNFELQGNGNQDSFQVAMNSNNLMTVETVLFQTNVTMSSGMIDVSQYAGQQAELFFGIVGGTSTNASLTVSDIAFYVTLPPLLQIQTAGTNVVLTWPLSGAGYVLQSANKLAPPVSWTTVTNVPVIVNFQYTVTNQISSGSVFYRLATIASPTLQAQVSGKNFILSWPTSATGYSLETTTNLTDPNSWMTLTNVPAIVNLQNTITNPASDGARFYRLKK